MKVSIFTDASVNHERKKGGYAFYIGCKTGSIKHSGKLGYDVIDPNIAELQCICNALKALKNDKKFIPVTKVWIFSDSQLAIDALSYGRMVSVKMTLRCAHLIREAWFLMLELSLKHTGNIRKVDQFFEFKKVKAHTGDKDIYAQINRWCDTQARKAMREQI